MSRRRRPPFAVSAGIFVVALVAGALAARGLPNGFAASLLVGADRVTTFSGPAPGDLGSPPQLTLIEMYDWDLDGRIDRLVATFDKTLGTPYTAGTAGWTLGNAPSGATVAAASVSGPWATLELTEGAGVPDTGVGTFTIALAATDGGVRDAEGRLASFGPTAPLDLAAPVPVDVATTTAGSRAGQMETGDAITVTFSEPLAAGSIPASAAVTQRDAAGADRDDSIEIPGITEGALATGGTDYVTKNEATATATAGVALTSDGRGIRVTLGDCTCGDAKRGQGAFGYTPAATITDLAGNTAVGSFTTPATFRLF